MMLAMSAAIRGPFAARGFVRHSPLAAIGPMAPIDDKEALLGERPSFLITELMETGTESSEFSRIHAEADALFDSVDTNGDGSISIEELQNHLQSEAGVASAAAVASIFTLFDADCNGQLSREELRESLVKYDDPHFRMVLGLGTSEADDVFDQIDTNRDGRVTAAELLEHMATSGYPNPDATSEMIFRALDIDSDGSVSRAELREGYTKYTAVRQALGLARPAVTSSPKAAPEPAGHEKPQEEEKEEEVHNGEEELVLRRPAPFTEEEQELVLRRPAPVTAEEMSEFAAADGASALTRSQWRRLQPVHAVKRQAPKKGLAPAAKRSQ